MNAGPLLALWLAASGPAPLPAARTRYADARTALQIEHTQVQAQQAQLDALAAQISSEKAKQADQPSLFVPGPLQNELAQSQALSDALGQSRAAEDARATDLEQRRAALYTALSAEISLRESRSAGDASALAELKQLQAERAQVAPQVSPTVAAPHFQGSSDDPRELRERADALRDQADKLGKQESALAARIQAAQDQARLEHQLQRLSGADSLFDESDRRVRVSHTDALPGATLNTATTGTAPTPSKSSAPPTGTLAQSTVGQTPSRTGSLSDALGNSTSPSADVAPAPTANASAPSPNSVPGATEVPTVRTGELVRAEQLGLGAPPADGDDENLPALLRARERLVKQRTALESQAKALESQAAGQK